MPKLKLSLKLQEGFASAFSDTTNKYAESSTHFCNFLLKLIDVDINLVNLNTVFNNQLTAFSHNPEVKIFFEQHPAQIIEIPRIKLTWLHFYISRAYVFLHTTTFSGKRIDDDSISQYYYHLVTRNIATLSFVETAIKEGADNLNFFRSKCKNNNWYYSIDSITNSLQDCILQPLKPNTFNLFLSLMNGIEPKFIDEFRDNFGKRMSQAIMLSKF